MEEQIASQRRVRFTAGEWDIVEPHDNPTRLGIGTSDKTVVSAGYDDMSTEYGIVACDLEGDAFIEARRSELDEMWGNAHLIKAGPNLYHALNNLLTHMNSGVGFNREWLQRLDELMTAGRRALERADGKVPPPRQFVIQS